MEVLVTNLWTILELEALKIMGNKSSMVQTCLICMVFLAPPAMVNAQVSFVPATNYAVGNTPVDIIAADLNGEGKVDLICANSLGQPGTLSMLTNNGSGVFDSSAILNVGSGPVSVVAVDINKAGKLALISANYAGDGSTLSVLTNNGSGIYGSNATLNVGALPDSLATADVNGDGKMDLICAMKNGLDGIIVFTNNGNGGFGSNATYNEGTFCISVMAVDITADGKVDLISLGSGGLIIWTNNGSGAFGVNADTNISGGGSCFTVADVNGDGKPDLISANASVPSKIFVSTNNGEGIFGSNATYTVGRGIVSITSADINGDGKVDLICANNESIPGTLLIMTNDGSGIFGSNTTLNVGSGPWAVIAADVNGDGKPDLVCANRNDNTISVLINTTIFPVPTSSPSLNIKPSGNAVLVSWPSTSAGWSLQQNRDLTTNWWPSGYSGYGIMDDGTNTSLVVALLPGNLFFRLLHP